MEAAKGRSDWKLCSPVKMVKDAYVWPHNLARFLAFCWSGQLPPMLVTSILRPRGLSIHRRKQSGFQALCRLHIKINPRASFARMSRTSAGRARR